MGSHYAPLSSGIMLFSMLGFVISALYLDNLAVRSWAFTFMVVFVVMFIASVISMTKAPIEEFAMDELGFHNKTKPKKKILKAPDAKDPLKESFKTLKKKHFKK